jgi:hypothetical protein
MKLLRGALAGAGAKFVLGGAIAAGAAGITAADLTGNLISSPNLSNTAVPTSVQTAIESVLGNLPTSIPSPLSTPDVNAPGAPDLSNASAPSTPNTSDVTGVTQPKTDEVTGETESNDATESNSAEPNPNGNAWGEKGKADCQLVNGRYQSQSTPTSYDNLGQCVSAYVRAHNHDSTESQAHQNSNSVNHPTPQSSNNSGEAGAAGTQPPSSHGHGH